MRRVPNELYRCYIVYMGQVHFQFKCCLELFVIFIQITVGDYFSNS